MSERDRELLDKTGLTVAEAADLIGRSRPALYQGLANDQDYLSEVEATYLLHYARRQDSSRLGELRRFVKAKFPPDAAQMILIDEVDFARLTMSVLPRANEITVLFNGGEVHMAPGAYFRKFLEELERMKIGGSSWTPVILSPADWTEVHARRAFPGLGARFGLDEMLEYAFTAALLKIGTEVRAFVFGRSGIEELPIEDATKLWEHYGVSVKAAPIPTEGAEAA